jgi:hypothetical protein
LTHSLQSSELKLKCASFGGRIVSLIACGHELLFPGESMEPPAVLPEGPDWLALKQGLGFPLLGGDKTWIAPEKQWLAGTPPMDLYLGFYRMESRPGGIVMTSPVCRETGLQVIRSIVLAADNTVLLCETILNASRHRVTRGIWNVTQVPRPFTVHIPGGIDQFRSYHEEDPTLPTPSFKITANGGMCAIPCSERECYKFGGMPSRGNVALIKPVPGGLVSWKRDFDIDLTRPYAHRSAVEVFNSHRYDYGEVEVHSPLVTLAPGERATLTQHWVFNRHDQMPDILSLC